MREYLTPDAAKISVDDYNGSACPNCESRDLVSDASPGLVGDGRVCLALRCGACGATWDETYVLSGYENLERKEIP